MSWKTLIINAQCHISLSLNRLKVKDGDEYHSYPINDLQTVIFAHGSTTITIPLLSALIDNKVGVIICNDKKDPIGILQSFNNHSLVFKHLKYQINWKLTRKKKLWKYIIEKKIEGEIKLLEAINSNKRTITRLTVLKDTVSNNDSTNNEGIAAKFYFKELFGESFIRGNDDPINDALNFGYKILASFISRFIASRGYLTQLGMHHIGEANPFNLPYDFIEVFRVYIDAWVVVNVSDQFTMKHRQYLINILNNYILFNKKKYRLNKVIETICDNYLAYLCESTDDIIKYNYDLSFYIREND